jgi:cell division protein FtsB
MNTQKIVSITKKIGKNRYFWATLGFVLWITWFDGRNLAKRSELNQKNKDLEVLQREYKKKIQETRTEIENLNKPEYIETIAREQYTMKKNNEDIYVVTKPEK